MATVSFCLPPEFTDDVIREIIGMDCEPVSVPFSSGETPGSWVGGYDSYSTGCPGYASLTTLGGPPNSNLVMTARAIGVAGNEISFALQTSGGSEGPFIAVTGTDIVATGALKGRMQVTGSITDGTNPLSFPILDYAGVLFFKAGFTATVGADEYLAVWDSDNLWWNLTYIKNSGESIFKWTSTADVDTPDLVPAGPWHATSNPHGWKPQGTVVGTPAITALRNSANQLISAIQAHSEANDLITVATAPGSDGTGELPLSEAPVNFWGGLVGYFTSTIWSPEGPIAITNLRKISNTAMVDGPEGPMENPYLCSSSLELNGFQCCPQPEGSCWTAETDADDLPAIYGTFPACQQAIHIPELVAPFIGGGFGTTTSTTTIPPLVVEYCFSAASPSLSVAFRNQFFTYNEEAGEYESDYIEDLTIRLNEETNDWEFWYDGDLWAEYDEGGGVPGSRPIGWPQNGPMGSFRTVDLLGSGLEAVVAEVGHVSGTEISFTMFRGVCEAGGIEINLPACVRISANLSECPFDPAPYMLSLQGDGTAIDPYMYEFLDSPEVAQIIFIGADHPDLIGNGGDDLYSTTGWAVLLWDHEAPVPGWSVLLWDHEAPVPGWSVIGIIPNFYVDGPVGVSGFTEVIEVGGCEMPPFLTTTTTTTTTSTTTECPIIDMTELYLEGEGTPPEDIFGTYTADPSELCYDAIWEKSDPVHEITYNSSIGRWELRDLSDNLLAWKFGIDPSGPWEEIGGGTFGEFTITIGPTTTTTTTSTST